MPEPTFSGISNAGIAIRTCLVLYMYIFVFYFLETQWNGMDVTQSVSSVVHTWFTQSIKKHSTLQSHEVCLLSLQLLQMKPVYVLKTISPGIRQTCELSAGSPQSTIIYTCKCAKFLVIITHKASMISCALLSLTQMGSSSFIVLDH